MGTTAEQEAAAAIVRAIRRVYGSPDAYAADVTSYKIPDGGPGRIDPRAALRQF
jgi:hypothetical protein